MCKRVSLSLFLFLCLVCFGHGGYAMAKMEDGLYVGGSRPVFFSMDDFFDRKQKADLIQAMKKVNFEKIYFVHNGKMASIAEILAKGKLEKAFYPYTPSKLESEYIRASNGKRLKIERDGADSAAPQIEFIR